MIIIVYKDYVYGVRVKTTNVSSRAANAKTSENYMREPKRVNFRKSKSMWDMLYL